MSMDTNIVLKFSEGHNEVKCSHKLNVIKVSVTRWLTVRKKSNITYSQSTYVCTPVKYALKNVGLKFEGNKNLI